MTRQWGVSLGKYLINTNQRLVSDGRKCLVWWTDILGSLLRIVNCFKLNCDEIVYCDGICIKFSWRRSQFCYQDDRPGDERRAVVTSEIWHSVNYLWPGLLWWPADSPSSLSCSSLSDSPWLPTSPLSHTRSGTRTTGITERYNNKL